MAQLDNRRRAYLDAMGIDIWVSSRGATSPERQTPEIEVNDLAQVAEVRQEKNDVTVESDSSHSQKRCIGGLLK